MINCVFSNFNLENWDISGKTNSFVVAGSKESGVAPPLVTHFTIIVISVTHYLVTINITINITGMEKFNKLDQHEPSLAE